MNLNPEQFKELKTFIEDRMTSFASDEEVKAVGSKISELEQQFLELLPQAKKEDKMPIIKTPYGDRQVFWDNEKQCVNFMNLMEGTFKNAQETIKDQTEGVDTEGGFLVAADYRAVLIRLIESYGVLRRVTTSIPMGSNQLVMPRLTGGVQVYWPDEGQDITEGAATFGNVTLTAKKMASLIPVSSELFEDSSIALANLFATLFGESMAQEEDRVGFAGNTTANDPFDGVLNDTNVNTLVMASTNDAFSDLTAKNLLDMQDELPSGALAGAVYLMHRSVFNHVRSLTDSTGNFIWQAPTLGAPGTIWGYPYELSESMPAMSASALSTPFITLGNWSHFYIGNRRNLSIASSQHIGFKSDRIYLRALQRIAMAIAIPTGFVNLVTAAS